MTDTQPNPSTRALTVTFGSFLVSLFSSALVHLGELPDPASQEKMKPDLDLARQTIDLIEVLQQKTAGNLDADEGELMAHVLYELRLKYVAARGSLAP
jgi:hypothetical protein